MFTSNAFAILGLRSIYFALANFMDKFDYLKYGISIVLIFIGIKMLIAEVIDIPIFYSLISVAGIISISVILSIFKKKS